jgi:hypothetical protein
MDGGLRALFRKHLPEFHWVAIESWMTGSGIPDVNFCCSGVEGWIEFKKTGAIAVRFKPGQIAWHEQRHRARGRTFIAVRRLAKGVDDLFLYPGEQARLVDDLGLEALPLLHCQGGPARWRWNRLKTLLLI